MTIIPESNSRSLSYSKYLHFCISVFQNSDNQSQNIVTQPHFFFKKSSSPDHAPCHRPYSVLRECEHFLQLLSWLPGTSGRPETSKVNIETAGRGFVSRFLWVIVGFSIYCSLFYVWSLMYFHFNSIRFPFKSLGTLGFLRL